MKCLEILEIKPNNLTLYHQALTHRSYAYEHKTESYERLEYLGDAILEFVISEHLFTNYPDMEEGDMTKERSKLVCTEALNAYALYLKLEDDLRLGKGEVKNLANRKGVLADSVEALIAAIYLDQGMDQVKDLIINQLINLESNFIDYKSKLQEAMQTVGKMVTYDLIKETGPAHDKLFTIVIKVDDIVYGKGSGKTKKEAEQQAALKALEKEAKAKTKD